ncbi:MAG TPA: fructosamine kinase family protein [Pirellulaceae bacterium]|nr:fructosamine kinase family protein [Pirellulaceae bacterium]
MKSETLQQVVREALGNSTTLQSIRCLAGGCIHDSRQLKFQNGSQAVVKIADRTRWPWLLAERDGLAAIDAQGAIRTPKILACYWSERHQWGVLLLEWIESAPPRPRDLTEFAERLAALHRQTTSQCQFGFDGDNFLGATSQPNPWKPGWCDFWTQHRWDHQLLLLRENDRGVRDLQTLGQQIAAHFPQLILEPERPSLIHGDLWSGNYLFDRSGEVVLIDPAAYYADREAEWGMIRLMGGLPDSFLADYHRAWPLRDGFEARCEVYQLYHLLNHVNLFGGGYVDTTRQAMRRLLRKLDAAA